MSGPSGADVRHPARRKILGALACAIAAPSVLAAARASPPVAVTDWLHAPDRPALPLPFDFLGLHSDHGLGGPTPPPSYPYDAIRSHDADDGTGKPVLQWASIETSPGIYDWRAFDRWIEANPSKTRVFVLCGCPTFYQKYPGEPWPYPDLPGGGSPPVDPSLAAAFIAAVVRRHPGKIHFVEPWNEPNFGAGGFRPFQDRWGPWMKKPGFFTGTAGDLAAMARAIRQVLPASSRLMVGAWEGQAEDATLGNSLLRFAAASDGAGGYGRDHVQALSVHAYTYNNDPNKLVAELRAYDQRFRQIGHPAAMARYVSECGAEAPRYWSAASPPLADKVRAIKRWCMIPAALGYQGVYLYKHSIMRTLGDPARERELAAAIAQRRNALRGRQIAQAAVLADETIWIAFADGGELRA
jgi:hypothetical protein